MIQREGSRKGAKTQRFEVLGFELVTRLFGRDESKAVGDSGSSLTLGIAPSKLDWVQSNCS